MKYIYLDQMHWISLAKAAKGRSDGSDFLPALNAAKDAVANQRAVFPLSFSHLLETARAPQLEQRETLATLMTRLSAGNVLRWSRPLVEFQLKNAVRMMFGEYVFEPEPSPFGRGVEDVFSTDIVSRLNLSNERADRLRLSLDTPDAWISLLSHSDEESRRAAIKSTDGIAIDAVKDYESRRVLWAGENADFARRAYAAILTKLFWLALQKSLHEIGRTVDDWGKSGPERLVEFWKSIPALDIELELHSQMHLQASKAWSSHDDRDIAFLALAIPACDVVVTEKFWVNLSERRKLQQRYDTTILSDLRKLPALIA
jgi:hypothetical protein